MGPSAAEQMPDVTGEKPDEAGHSYPREQVGGGHAHARGCGRQAPFRRPHVRAPAQ